MVTLGLAILLGTGLLAAKLCQRLRLPSVTGYVLAGLLLGPSGFNLINEARVGHELEHFTHIALMLIAFGIGEHIELTKLREHAKSLTWIVLSEALVVFCLISVLVFVTMRLTGFEMANWQLRDYLVIALLLGTIGIATAPAATLIVVRELRASGPLTSTLLATVAIDNGLAIMLFGLAVSLAHQIVGQGESAFFLVVGSGLREIGLSLLLGIFTGILLDITLKRLKSEGEMMTGALALLLLCSEFAIYLNLSPLLAGMAAGFILVNRAERDVRIFRTLNKFEPPVIILFFTLAATHLDVRSLGTAGVLGTVYFVSRVAGKIIGVACGARFGRSPLIVQRYLGFTLVPQAGVAIGLIFLIASDPRLEMYSVVITPVVLTGVFLSELIGPVAAKFAMSQAGEAHALLEEKKKNSNGLSEEEQDKLLRSAQGVSIVPWTWEKLNSAPIPRGVVAFGVGQRETVAGLARFATILAHHVDSLPLAIRVEAPEKQVAPGLFRLESEEVNSLGYPMLTQLVQDKDVASGLVSGVEYNNARGVVLGYPVGDRDSNFPEVLEKVAGNVTCPVIVVRFFGELHTERILIPITTMEDLEEVYPVVAALDSIGEHQAHLLYLLQSDVSEEVMKKQEQTVCHWLKEQQKQVAITVQAIATDSRVESILQESRHYDLVVMGATRTRVIQKFFFGSLVDSVSKKLQKTLLIVYMPEESLALNRKQ